MSLSITPETTVGALLEAYPAAEEVLIDMAPAFGKLRNPLVRKTVAKVATLEQAAKIGGVTVPAMIRRLREATGQQGPELPIPQSKPESGDDAGWLMDCPVALEVDADAMLEMGVHPIGKVREGVAALTPGNVVVLRASFRPDPLISALRRTGALVHCDVQGSRHSIYFGKTRD